MNEWRCPLVVEVDCNYTSDIFTWNKYKIVFLFKLLPTSNILQYIYKMLVVLLWCKLIINVSLVVYCVLKAGNSRRQQALILCFEFWWWGNRFIIFITHCAFNFNIMSSQQKACNLYLPGAPKSHRAPLCYLAFPNSTSLCIWNSPC